MQMKNFRREILINPKFQLKIMAYFIVPVFIVISLNYFFLIKMMNDIETLYLSDPSMRVTPKILALHSLFESFNRIYVISSAVLIFVLIFWGVIVSFRIAGPAYRIKKYFNESDPNELREITLRKDDMLKDVTDAYNNNLNKFKKKD